MNCKICNEESSFIFDREILNKHKVDYFKCSNCGFIQTEEPFWLKEAYNEAIGALDVGIIARNIYFADVSELIIRSIVNVHSKFIDFGGGYGMFVRIMRDRGFDFFRQDPYCENLFAKFFDIEDIEVDKREFKLLTAFELFEHLENPREDLKEMVKFSNNILFSTELQPAKNIENWDYILPETGQHISFFTIESLEFLAKEYKLRFYTNGINIHLLTKLQLKNNPFKDIYKFTLLNKILKKIGLKKEISLKSFTQVDYNYIKDIYKARRGEKGIRQSK